MATGVVAVPAMNGTHAPSASDLVEYEKIIRLRDSVFAGQHPRLKLTSSSTSEIPEQTTSANAQAIASNNAVNASLNPDNTNNAVKQPSLVPPVQPNGQHMPAVLPGFDPVLLEKSPLLIATEQNISRKSLEAAIQQEVKRRATLWPKLDRENILPSFDVDEILHKAQEQVKPVFIDTDKLVMKDKSPARSADEQSYYSSQAHDDDGEDPRDKRAQNASKPCMYFFKKGNCFKGQDCKFSHDPAFAAQLKPEAPLTEADRSYANVGYGGPPTKKQKRDDAQYGHHNNSTINVVEDDAKRRADEQYQKDLARAGQGQYDDPGFDPRYVPAPPKARHLPPQDRRFSGRVMTPSRDVPVVRSTITSPLAPQPARVSPLAMKGPPYIEKVRVSGTNGPSSQQVSRPHSPPPNQQTLNRKRRRDTNGANGPEASHARRRLASPEVRIKDEPTSPKPVDAVPRYVPREEIVRRPVDVDAYSPHGGRIEQRPVREVHYIDDPGYRRVSSPVVRVVSRPEPRPEFRREPELRRVVSERQMIHAESPTVSTREPVYYNDSPRAMLPPREVFVTRPDAEAQGSYRGSVAPVGPPTSEYPAEMRRGRSPPAAQAGSMAPPPPTRERIVRDQYGNEYYERIVAEPPRYSVAPETRYVAEPQHSGRPVSRVGSVVPESSRQFVEPPQVRRADPELTSPRYADYPSQSSVRTSSVAPALQGDFAPERPQVVRVSDYPGEQRYERVVHEAPRVAYAEHAREVYYDDAPRDNAYRVQSVRPEATRYVDADNRYVRQVSVHPAEGGYERVVHSMAPPPPRYEYADGRGVREYTVGGGGQQYVN